MERSTGALGIVNSELDPVAVPEIELDEIAVKVPLRAMLIDADHPAFEDAEEALDGLGVGVSPNPFLFGVINGFMAGEAPADRAVHMRLIGAQMAGSIGVVENDLADFASGDGLDLHRACLAAALNEGDDLPLVAIGPLPLPAVLGMQDPSRAAFNVALESLVNLNDLAFAAERTGTALVHHFADAVADEPSGLDVDAKDAGELVYAEALLGRAHQVDRLQPDVQRDVARFEDGPDLDSERLPTRVALVDTDPGALAFQRPRAIYNAAMRAYPTVRPYLRLDVSVGGALIGNGLRLEQSEASVISL